MPYHPTICYFVESLHDGSKTSQGTKRPRAMRGLYVRYLPYVCPNSLAKW